MDTRLLPSACQRLGFIRLGGLILACRFSGGSFSDAIGGVELAPAAYRAMFRNPLVEDCRADKETAELLPDMTMVVDSGGPSRSLSFESIIQRYPELGYVCTRVKSPGQRGV